MTFTTHDVHSRHTTDGSASGSYLAEADNSASCPIVDSLLNRLRDVVIRYLNIPITENGKTLILKRMSTVRAQEVGVSDALVVDLVNERGKITFALRRGGSKGTFLNAWWNPNKFFSGQNVFPMDLHTDTEYLGVRWKGLPHQTVEYPFKLFVRVLDRLTGNKSWDSRNDIVTRIVDHSIFWQRLDFTLYSSEMASPESVLAMLSVAGESRKVLNLRNPTEGPVFVVDTETLLNVSYRGEKHLGGYSYARLGRLMESKGKKASGQQKRREAFFLTFYLKELEVLAKKKTNQENFKVLTKNPGVVERRLRQEFSFMSSGILYLESFRRVLLAGTENDKRPMHDGTPLKVNQSACLLAMFPNLETFVEKSNQLLVIAMQELKLEWILQPKDPTLYLERVERNTKKGELLDIWESQVEKRLPSVVELAKRLEISVVQVRSLLQEIETEFGDIRELSYYACLTLFYNAVSACASTTDDQRLLQSSVKLERNPENLKAREQFIETRTSCAKRFKKLKVDVASNFSAVSLSRNLKLES